MGGERPEGGREARGHREGEARGRGKRREARGRGERREGGCCSALLGLEKVCGTERNETKFIFILMF